MGIGLMVSPVEAQNRGVYPLGMTALNSGITPTQGWTYSNQLLYYFRDSAKDDSGDTESVVGSHYVLMDMNTFAWAHQTPWLGNMVYSAAATLPFAKNNLTSETNNTSSGGSGFADSYYMPVILGWNEDRVSVKAVYGFLAPTGKFVAGETDNVGSGYWTHTLSSGQTVYLRQDKHLTLSIFEMYEFHTHQEDTHTHPGQTFDLDYSVMGKLPWCEGNGLELGLVGYEQRQTTATTGPSVSSAAANTRYAINALGVAIQAAFPKQNLSIGLKYFKEFANRSSFEGYSLQGLGSIRF